MKVKTILILLVMALIASVGLVWLMRDSAPEPAPVREKPATRRMIAEKPAAKVAETKTAKQDGRRSARKPKRSAKKGKRISWPKLGTSELSEADCKLSDAVQSALDDNDFKATQKAALAAMKSENPEVRKDAVDALGWFGDKALVELTRAMADPDSDVSEAARDQVENALMGMEDDDRAVVLAGEYVNLFVEDDDAVTMFAGVLSTAGSRIIDPDDSNSAEDVARAKGNRAGIVDIVAEMVEKGGKLEERGMEIYREIVGKKWTGRAAADKWVDDIEEPGDNFSGKSEN